MRREWLTTSESSGRWASRGFTLVEVIVVVALIAILAMVGFGELNKVSRREKLANYSIQLTTLLQQAALTVRQRDAVTFVRIGPAYAVGDLHFRDIDIVVDTCCPAATGNGKFEDPKNGATGDSAVKDVLPAKAGMYSMTVPLEQISFSLTSAASPYPMDPTMTWPAGSVADTWVIGVNFRGQTIEKGGTTLPGPAVLSMTHVDMVSGSLTPLINYQTVVNSVWDVAVHRVLADGTNY